MRQRAHERLHRPQHQHQVRGHRAGHDLPLGADQGPAGRDRAQGAGAPELRGRGQHRGPQRQRDDGHRPPDPVQQGPDRGPDRPLAQGGRLEQPPQRDPRLRARGHHQPPHPAAARGLRAAQEGSPEDGGALPARLPRAAATPGRAGVGPTVARGRDPEPRQGGLFRVPDGPDQGALARDGVQRPEGRGLPDEQQRRPLQRPQGRDREQEDPPQLAAAARERNGGRGPAQGAADVERAGR